MISFKLLILTSLLQSILSDGDLHLKDQPQDNNIDPLLIDSSKESHRLTGNDKRTIFGNLLDHNNYALARHFVYRNGLKYLLGYGQVDLRYTPHFKPVFVKPRYSVLKYKHSSVYHEPTKPVAPIKPPSVTVPASWKPLITHPAIPVPTTKPVGLDVPVYIPSLAPEQEQTHYEHVPAVQHPIHHPIKLNLPVLPYGAMFLTPIIPHQHHPLQYYPFPIQAVDQPFPLPNPHPHVALAKPIIEHEITPGSSYEIHGYQPHHHILTPPSTAIPYNLPYSQQEEVVHYQPEERPQLSPALLHDNQPYVGSLEFHGNPPSYNHEHVIQPGQTDVQIPQHLLQHPNYHPEDYYSNLSESTGPYQGYVAGDRSSEDKVERLTSVKAPFKPSQRIWL